MSASIYGQPGVSSAQVGALLHPGIASGSVLGPILTGAGATGSAVAVNTLYAMPILVPTVRAYSGLRQVVGTAVAGVLGKMALYAPGSDGAAGTLIEECAGTADMSSAANTELAIDFASPRVLQVGWYWVTGVYNGAAQPYTMPTTLIGAGGAVSIYGGASLSSFVRTGFSGSSNTRATQSQTYADPFPASLTVTYGTGTPGCPLYGIAAT